MFILYTCLLLPKNGPRFCGFVSCIGQSSGPSQASEHEEAESSSPSYPWRWNSLGIWFQLCLNLWTLHLSPMYLFSSVHHGSPAFLTRRACMARMVFDSRLALSIAGAVSCWRTCFALGLLALVFALSSSALECLGCFWLVCAFVSHWSLPSLDVSFVALVQFWRTHSSCNKGSDDNSDLYFQQETACCFVSEHQWFPLRSCTVPF